MRLSGCGTALRELRQHCAAFLCLLVTAAVSLMPNLPAAAQQQLLTEQNFQDAILERKVFESVERAALDLNEDQKVDVADLVFFLMRSANLFASASFETAMTSTIEGANVLRIPVTLTKPVTAQVNVQYTVKSTATCGPKAQGGDFEIAGYDAASGAGSIAIAAGETKAYLLVTIHDDGLLNEGVESIAFSLAGGSTKTYFLGALQTHTVYIDDNDGVWTAGLELDGGPGYLAINLEMVQEEGRYSGRVLADDGLVPLPEEEDASRSGDNGWQAKFSATGNALRLDIGPIPVDDSLSFFAIDYSRYFTLEIRPSLPNYQFDPNRAFSGRATQILEPVRGRLGPVWQERRYLRRETTGNFAMFRHVSAVIKPEVTLEEAE